MTTSRDSESVNPLQSDDPADWDRLMESIQPASILVLLRKNLSGSLARTVAAEDLWQETLFQAWRDREKCEWRGLADFRRWVVSVAMNRLRDAAEREGAARRGGGNSAAAFSTLHAEGETQAGLDRLLPAGSTTPSRLAIYREQARCMESALDGLPDDLRDVVRLRLFEERPLADVAERLSLGVSAVRHRLRRGAAAYAELLNAALSASALGNVR